MITLKITQKATNKNWTTFDAKNIFNAVTIFLRRGTCLNPLTFCQIFAKILKIQNMFNLLRKIIVISILSFLGVYVCKYLFPAIEVTTNTPKLVLFVLLISIISVTIKPILNIILKPFIFLTLGILSIIINMGVVFLANYYTNAIVINNNFTLFQVAFVLALVTWLASFVVAINAD